jgi:hypothetical protein
MRGDALSCDHFQVPRDGALAAEGGAKAEPHHGSSESGNGRAEYQLYKEEVRLFDCHWVWNIAYAVFADFL